MMEEAQQVCQRVGVMVNSGQGGDFVCLDTINNLVNETSEGYQIEISTAKLSDNERKEVQGIFDEKFPSADCSDDNSIVLSYQIPRKDYKLSEVFTVAIEMYKNYRCEYVISQMTMDQLFLTMTSLQRKEDEDDLVATGRAALVQHTCCGCVCCACGKRPKFVEAQSQTGADDRETH